MSHVTQPARNEQGPSESLTARLRDTAKRRGARLEHGRRTGLFVAIGKRFVEIDGGTFGGLMAIELFTTVLPLMILGFGYFSGFAANASVGTMFVRQLGSPAPANSRARRVRHFGCAAVVVDHSRAGRLVDLGHPDGDHRGEHVREGVAARTVHRARAALARAVWFVLYLAQLIVRERIAFGASPISGCGRPCLGVSDPGLAVLDAVARDPGSRRCTRAGGSWPKPDWPGW